MKIRIEKTGLSAALILAIIVGIIFGRALFPGPNELLFGYDVYDLQYFLRTFFRNSLKAGAIPFWNPYLFSGYPGAANPEGYNLFYPLSYLFLILPLNTAFSWYSAFHLFWAALGMYRLASLFAGPAAALTAGAVFAFSGFFSPRIYAGHTDIIASASWMPWIVAGVWKFIGKEKINTRDFLSAVLVMTFQLLAGYQTMAFFTIITLIFISLVSAIFRKSILPVTKTAAVIFFGLALAAIQLLPTFEFVLRSVRGESQSYEKFVATGELTTNNLSQLIYGWYGDFRKYPVPKPPHMEHVFYAGGAALVLIVVSAIGRLITAVNNKKPKTVNVFLLTVILISIYGIWVSFGSNAFIDLQYLLWRFVPGYSLIRIPPRHLLLFVFGMSVLAGFAVESIRRKRLRAMVTALIILELAVFSRHYVELGLIPEVKNDRNIVGTVTPKPGEFRLMQNYLYTVRLGYSLDFNSPVAYGIEATNGFDPAILANYFDVSAAYSRYHGRTTVGLGQMPPVFPDEPLIDYLNVKFVHGEAIWLTEADPLSRDYLVRIDNKSSWYKLWENKTYKDRFFFVNKLREYPSRAELIADMEKRQLDINSEAGIVSARKSVQTSACQNPEAGKVSISAYKSNRIELVTENPCDAHLVSSEVYYPGWQAKIDGKNAEIFEINGAFRGLSLPAGRHTITFYYLPLIYLFGGIISVTTFGFLLLPVIFSRWSSTS